jgi:hypothetical protein
MSKRPSAAASAGCARHIPIGHGVHATAVAPACLATSAIQHAGLKIHQRYRKGFASNSIASAVRRIKVYGTTARHRELIKKVGVEPTASRFKARAVSGLSYVWPLTISQEIVIQAWKRVPSRKGTALSCGSLSWSLVRSSFSLPSSYGYA